MRVEATPDPSHLAATEYTKPAFVARAGATKTSETGDAYELLAKTVQPRLKSQGQGTPELSVITTAFKSLSVAQKTFKGLDGAAHEAYQRTHTADDVDISVSGWARRSAARAGAAADGLGACELCELVEFLDRFDSTNGTLANRQVLLNAAEEAPKGGLSMRILVLYGPDYQSGSGDDHGGLVDDTIPSHKRATERLLLIMAEGEAPRWQRTIKVLDRKPMHFRLKRGLVTNEVVSVQPVLYKTASSVLTTIEPLLRSQSNTTAIHFTGRSLAGGVAALPSKILQGGLSMPGEKSKKKRDEEKPESASSTDTTAASGYDSDNSTATIPLQGLGKDRTSAVSLGVPPGFSANVKCDFVTSILYGDDVVCRASEDSIDRFFERIIRALKWKGLVGRQMNRMRDTVSLATSNIKSHAHSNEGEESRLTILGRAYLVRPRRLGHYCSIHEVGAQLKGGREALRAAVLWQLNDILLTRNLWKHHTLDSYIHGLDRVHLRGVHEEDEE